MTNRAKTTPASTGGSYAPATGRTSRVEPDDSGGAAPFTDGHQLIDLHARLQLGNIINRHHPDAHSFTLVRDRTGTVIKALAHGPDGDTQLQDEAAVEAIAFCAAHPTATSTVNTTHIPSTVDHAQHLGLHALHGVPDPRFAVVNDWNGTPQRCVLDENMANWALNHGVGRTFTSATGDDLVKLYPTWSATAIAGCYDHPITPETWATMPDGTIIRHPTSCWNGNPDGTDGDIVFRSYNPDTGELSYSEIGSANVNTVEPGFVALFRTYPTGTPL